MLGVTSNGAPTTGTNGNGGEADPWQRTRFGLLALAGLLTAGTVTYRLLGLGWIDAYYQTVITVSTVGYTEVGPSPTPLYRIVSSFVILGGVGITAYTIGVAFDGLMEGRLREQFGRTRMQREIDQLEGHVVVCGWGQVGQAIASALTGEGQDVVVIDRRPDLEAGPGPNYLVTGDATDDTVLQAAGVGRARGLISALDDDSDNLWVTLSARSMNPELFIVSRSNGPGSGPKLLQAGADRVVNPHEIGGDRMASLMTHPNIVDFIGETMADRKLQIRLAEAEVGPSSLLVERPLGESGLAEATGVTMLAIRQVDGSFVHHPPPDHVLAAGDVLIVLGTPEQQYALRAWMDDEG